MLKLDFITRRDVHKNFSFMNHSVCKFVIQSAVGSAMSRIAINSFEGRTDKVITSRILLTWLFVLGVGYLSRFSLFQDPEETLYNYPANNQYERTGYLQIFRKKINKKCLKKWFWLCTLLYFYSERIWITDSGKQTYIIFLDKTAFDVTIILV